METLGSIGKAADSALSLLRGNGASKKLTRELPPPGTVGQMGWWPLDPHGAHWLVVPRNVELQSQKAELEK